MAFQKPIFNQTNYDMVNQLYGNMDLLIKMAIDNGIEDLNLMSNIYYYDNSDKRINANFTGYSYATNFNPEANICMIPTGLNIYDVSSFSLTFSWDNPSGLNFQYALNDTGNIPTPAEWIDTTASVITAMGLTDDKDWYVWLRTKCSDGVYSNPINDFVHTLPFVCSIISGGSVGSITDTTAVANWASAPGPDDYLYGVTDTGLPPVSTTNIFVAGVNITGLSPSTNYEFYVRRQCDPTHLSSWFVVPFTTLAPPPPAPPVISDLVLALFSDYGVTALGSNVVKWDDLISGFGTSMVLNTVNQPQIVNTHFGGKDGMRFPLSGLSQQMLRAPFTLLSGGKQCTVFIVMSAPHSASGAPVTLGVSTTFGSSPSNGGFFIQHDPSDTILHQSKDSTGGANSGNIPYVPNVDFLLDYVFNTMIVGVGDRTKLYHNDSSAAYVVGPSGIGTGTLLGTEIRIGYPSNEVVGCVLIYNRALNNVELTATWTYLQTYFSL